MQPGFIKSFIVGMFILLMATACQNDGRWYPEASVSIETQSEYTDVVGMKHLAVAVVIRNAGITSITSGVVTLKAVTDKRTYLQTMGSDAKIIPGGAVVLTFRIDYFEVDETLDKQLPDSGVSLYDSFFD
jgi:hypothetical protein